MIGFIYLLAIVCINWIFAYSGPYVGAVLVGTVFVLRDYVQQKYGHYVILWMIAACILSFFLASKVVAVASLTAFLAAEGSDWLVFSVLPYKFHYRVLFSSIIGVAVDSLIFIPMALGVFDLQLVAVMWCSKMIAALAVFTYYQVKA